MPSEALFSGFRRHFLSVQGKPHGLIARTGKAIRTDTPKE
ncbi:hypothetical protein HMPREF0602_0960 [Neisseria meningitidis ATCC 13091]|uniref:Uncharacterized protein n=1 Tax=Neisseria meningitidis serogroup B (strain ATCC 13091 / M2091) TaxID=862513 RepID=E0N8Y0_NEIM3|nr:hypothetical protein HMPREF0602_0960 [Neisseria meningitidis ATCC 13091]